MQIAINQNIKNEFKDYFNITLGLMLYTFGFTIFLLPYQIVTGGVTGLAAVIYYGTNIPIYLSYFVINVILLALALKILGLKFMLKTIYAIFMLSFMLAVAQDWATGPNGELTQVLGEGQDFMSLVIGCCCTGLSLAIVFLNNGSTGGTDIIAAVVNKYHNISLGRVLIFVDFIIVGSSFFVFDAKPGYETIDAVRKVVFGLCTMVIENLMLDYVMNARRESVQFLIFSKKYQEIANAVVCETHRFGEHVQSVLYVCVLLRSEVACGDGEPCLLLEKHVDAVNLVSVDRFELGIGALHLVDADKLVDDRTEALVTCKADFALSCCIGSAVLAFLLAAARRHDKHQCHESEYRYVPKISLHRFFYFYYR